VKGYGFILVVNEIVIALWELDALLVRGGDALLDIGIYGADGWLRQSMTAR